MESPLKTSFSSQTAGTPRPASLIAIYLFSKTTQSVNTMPLAVTLFPIPHSGRQETAFQALQGSTAVHLAVGSSPVPLLTL